MPDDAVLERLEAQFAGVRHGVRRVLGRRRFESRAGRRRARSRARERGGGHRHLADVSGRRARRGLVRCREPRRRARGRRDERVRRRAVRRELARALLLLQGRAPGRAGGGRRAARRRDAGGRRQRRRRRRPPSPGCAPPPSAASRTRCWRPASAKTRCGACRESSAWPRGTRRSRPVLLHASPTASRSRRTSSRRRRGRAGAARARLSPVPRAAPRRRRRGLEVEAGELERRSRCAKSLRRRVHAAGFTYVTLDLEGFRSGSMNEA